MNNFLPKVFFSLTLLLFSLPATVFADGVCKTMKITHVGMSPAAPSGVELFLTNTTTAACAGIQPNVPTQMYLSTTNTDKTLAVILTAASLKKDLWAYITGTQAPYIVAFVQVLNITD